MTKLTDYLGAIISGVDLGSVPTVTQVTITNTGGTDAIILDATSSRAGVMTKAQVDKLNGIDSNANNYVHPSFTSRNADIDTGPMTGPTVISDLDLNIVTNSQGHVTSASFAMSKRDLSLSDLGFTGDPNANFYVHPSYTPRGGSTDTGLLSGAQVISRILTANQSDGQGHVTSLTFASEIRTLTPQDIGAAPAADIPDINSGTFTPSFAGGTSNGVTNGICVYTTIGNLVIVTGRINWTTPPTGSGQMRITGLPFTADYDTGFGFSGNNVENQANAANGMHITMSAGANELRIWGYNENGVSSPTTGNDFNSGGYININFSYYSSQVNY
jgi:hypothetical protein